MSEIQYDTFFILQFLSIKTKKTTKVVQIIMLKAVVESENLYVVIIMSQ